MKTTLKKILLSLSMLAVISPVFAGTASGSLKSSATLSSSCILSALSISFGQINTTSDNTANGRLYVQCTKGTTYQLIVGSGNSNNQLQRTMAGGASGDKLKYNIYTDSGDTTVMGDGSNATSQPTTVFTGLSLTQTGTSGTNYYSSTGATVTWMMYGLVPANQYVSPDSYLDTLSVSVTY